MFYKEEFALGFRRLLDLLIDTEKEIHQNLHCQRTKNLLKCDGMALATECRIYLKALI